MPSSYRFRSVCGIRSARALFALIFVLACSSFWSAPVLWAQSVRFSGVLTTVAGNGTPGYNSDNIAATSAQLVNAYGVAVDAAGNLYIADSGNNRVRKVATDGTITTVAGTGSAAYGGDGGLATAAQLNAPYGVAVDGSGNLYIADNGNHRIRKVAATDGKITTVAGTGTQGNNGDNIAATSAQLNGPTGVAVDGSGNLYIADSSNHRVRKVAAGIITTVAGDGTQSYGGDGGDATLAQLNTPTGVAVDGAGNLYIAEYGGQLIRKVTAGIITTVAGDGTQGYGGDGSAATSATLNNPFGVAVDGSGNFYIADYLNHRIRKVAVATGIIATLAGDGNAAYGGDGGVATSAQLSNPAGVAVDGSGNLYIADLTNFRVRKVEISSVDFGSVNIGPGGVTYSFEFSFTGGGTQVGNVAALTGGAADKDFQSVTGGTCTPTTYADGSSCTVNVNFSPLAPGVRKGAVVLYDNTNHPLITIYISGNGVGPAIGFGPGIITTVAGTGTGGYGDDNGAATGAQLNNPSGAAVDGVGNLYIADYSNNRVRKVGTDGFITTVAGTGIQGSSGDNGPATSAQLFSPAGVAVDGAGNLYIADYNNHRIRKVTAATGIITTVAGTGIQGASGDNGAATSAQLDGPNGVALDRAGNLYIAEYDGHRVRKVTVATGIITTVAGTGIQGASGDNGAATSAQLDGPSGVALDRAGNLYIADTTNNRIRKVGADGIITTVAGTGIHGASGDNGAATSAQLYGPSGVAVDGAGNLYIADTFNNRIRKVGADGIITTVAGNWTSGYGGDGGPATDAKLSFPFAVTMDATGNLYIADYGNNRIRKVNLSDPPSLTFSNTNTGAVSAAQDVTIQNLGNAQLSISKIDTGANFSLGGAHTSCSTHGQPIDPSGSCILGIQLAPTSAGLKSESVVLTDNSLNAPGPGYTSQSIALSGTGVVVPSATVVLASVSLTLNHAVSSFTPVTGSGGTGSLSYSISPSLPTGLSMSTSTAAITGTPRVTRAATSYTVTVTDANSATASNTFTLTVNSAVAATQAVSSATVTQNVAITSFTPVTGSGGTSLLSYSISPSLPAGLSFNNSTGAITGTPTATSASAVYTVTVTDSNSATASNTFSLTVNGPLAATQAIPSKALTQNHAVSSFTAVTGSGGLPSLSYSISPPLPAGLSFNMSTGMISGTPTVLLAATSYTVTITDANSATASNSFTLTVNSAVVAMQTTASKALTQNHAATSFTPVTGSGGTAPLSYGLSPSLPAGLSFDNSTGAITGTPTATSASASYTVTVTDANSATASNAFTLTVNGPVAAAQAIASKTLTQNHAATSFTPVTGSGGTGTLNYSVSPSLPVGLSLSTSTGAITGTPMVASAATSYTVTVTDANSATATNTFILTVNSGVAATQAIASRTLTQNHAATAFTPVTGSGGTAPLSYGVSPSLPAGLSFNNSTGAITGTPTVPSAATSYTVTVTDANSATALNNFTLTVNSAVTATPAVSSTSMTVDQATSTFTPVTGSGGTGALSYSVSPSLPTGLSLTASSGAISGTPTAASASTTYTVTVTDANSATATASFSLTVDKANATVVLTPSSLTQTYTGSALASAATTIPSGLTVNFAYTQNNQPVVAPTNAGSYAVTATISDANYRGSTTGTLTVAKATPAVTIWPSATGITFGQTLASSTLSGGSAAVGGAFAWTAPPTAPNAGTASQGITFTPTDTTNYNTVTSTVSVTVNKATPSVTAWPSATGITYGQTLASSILSGGTASVGGTFAWTTPTTAPGAGTASQNVTFTPTDTTNYNTVMGTASVAVTKAAASLTLTSSSNPALVGYAVTLTATAPSGATGTVDFYDGATRLASVTLSQGVAAYTTSSLAAGAHSLTASYAGDSNFLSATSVTVSQNVTDYTVTGGTGATGGNGGSGSTTDVPTQTVQPGGTATYNVQVAPSVGATLPADLVLTVTHNLPAGSTVMLTASGLSTSGSRLVLPGGQAMPAVQMTVHMVSITAARHRSNPLSTMPFAFGFVLLPFGARLGRVTGMRVRRVGLGLVLLLVALAAIVGLAGCGAVNTGYSAQRNYTITVTATSGTLSHSTNFNLTVQ